MSALSPAVVCAVLRKDLISLWPVALTALLLPICLVGDLLVEVSEPIQLLLAAVGVLATVALTLTVFHHDAAASVRHDWRTRPIGGPDLLVAKLVFLFLTLAVPIGAAFVARELIRGHSMEEAGLVGLMSLSMMALAALPVLALALVTTSLIEALALAFGLVITMVLGRALLPRVTDGGGADWTVDALTWGLGIAFIVAVIVLVLRRRAPSLARAVYVGGLLICALAFSQIPGSVAVALQQALPGDEAAARGVTASMSSFCERDLTGRIAIDGVPIGTQVVVDDVRAEAIDVAGRSLGSVPLGRSLEARTDQQPEIWKVRAYRSVAGSATIRWTYALTLLEPKASRTLLIDGKRRFLPGFGYCQADHPGVTRTRVSCFKPFDQPAAVSIQASGETKAPCLTCAGLNYQPGLFDGFGRERSRLVAVPKGTAAVTLTAYETRAHFTRRSVTSACKKKG